VLVVTRFRVPEADASGFRARAEKALTVLGAQRGHLRGRLGRAADDPELWALVTEWSGTGAYRRALSAYDVKVHAAPLLGQAIDEPGAFEVLWSDGVTGEPDRAPDAATAAPGEELRRRAGG
jgi:hypothetical protein